MIRLALRSAALLLAGSTVAAPPELVHPIVFVKQTPVPFTFSTVADIFGNFEGFYPPWTQPLGGNLFRLDPDGTVVALTARGNAAVRDPEVSYDGERLLFSMRVGGHGRWQVYEIGIDGAGLRRVSRDGAFHDLDPAYLPDRRIVFTTDRRGWADGYENLPAAQVAVMQADGSAVEVLKSGPAGQFNPLVGSDGMLYFTQWDFHDRRASIHQDNSDFDVNRFLLWKLFADGSGLDHPTFGSHTVYDFAGGYTEVRELPGQPGTFLAVLANEFFTFGAGALVRIDPQANADLESPVLLTENVFDRAAGIPGRWRSPYPLADGRIVAAFAEGPVFADDDLAAGEVPRFHLVVMNADGSGQRQLYRDDAFWSWQPVEAAPRPVPTLAAGDLRPEFPYAIVNAFDVTLRGRNEDRVVNGDFQPRVARGQAKRVRFYREDVGSPNAYEEFPSHADPDIAVLGTAPVHPDGSFAAVVPADVPLSWELLDAAGKTIVRERFGTELRAGEVRQCAGCHTPHDGRSGRTTNQALASPTNLSGKEVDLDGDGTVDLLQGTPTGCVADARALCLNDGRFRVEVTWRDFDNRGGAGAAVPITADTGYFYFFDPENVELTVKIVDGRGSNGHFWVFYGSLTNVAFELTVTDTTTGVRRGYSNPAGIFASKGDVTAF